MYWVSKDTVLNDMGRAVSACSDLKSDNSSTHRTLQPDPVLPTPESIALFTSWTRLRDQNGDRTAATSIMPTIIILHDVGEESIKQLSTQQIYTQIHCVVRGFIITWLQWLALGLSSSILNKNYIYLMKQNYSKWYREVTRSLFSLKRNDH